MQNKIILEYIKANLGKDLNNNYNELGCAQTVNNILKACLGYEAGGGPSTKAMYESLNTNQNFITVTTSEARAGDIILSPTGQGNGNVAHGHVGFLGDNGIVYSNNSAKDMLDDHITAEEWRNYFVRKGGYPVYYYRAVGKPLIQIKEEVKKEATKPFVLEKVETPSNYDDRKSNLFEVFTKSRRLAFNISSTKIFMLMLAGVVTYSFTKGLLKEENFMYIALSVIAFYTGNKIKQ